MNILRPTCRASLLGLLLLTPVTRNQATTLVRLSVEEMTGVSSHVALGTCAAVESRWNDAHDQILTYVTLGGVEPLKGEGGTTVTFALLGGTVGDTTIQAVGAPEFRVGEEMVVFLHRMPGSDILTHGADLWIVGLGQGKWHVTRDSGTGEAKAHVSTGAARVIEKAGVPAEETLSLSNLVARVRDAAAR